MKVVGAFYDVQIILEEKQKEHDRVWGCRASGLRLFMSVYSSLFLFIVKLYVSCRSMSFMLRNTWENIDFSLCPLLRKTSD